MLLSCLLSDSRYYTLLGGPTVWRTSLMHLHRASLLSVIGAGESLQDPCILKEGLLAPLFALEVAKEVEKRRLPTNWD